MINNSGEIFHNLMESLSYIDTLENIDLDFSGK